MSSTDSILNIIDYVMRDKNAIIYNNTNIQYGSTYGSAYGHTGFRGGNNGCPDGNGIERAFSINGITCINFTNYSNQ